MGQIAIFGGTFDPVHWGHLLLAETALSQVGLDRVIWVPAPRPPHKRALAYKHRRLMVEKAIADNPAFAIEPIEIGRSSRDREIETLAYLQNTYLNCQWYWIIGLDAFQTLPKWYHRERLIPAYGWLVAPRLTPIPTTAEIFLKRDEATHKNTDTPDSWLCQQVVGQLASQNISICWQLLQMPQVDISSSLIRQYCHQCRSIRYLVPEEVRVHIATHNLYSKTTTI
jgi:nicotinate-nucleotide adenylyltransferase